MLSHRPLGHATIDNGFCVLSHRPLGQLHRALGRAQSRELNMRREKKEACPVLARNLVACAARNLLACAIGGGRERLPPTFPVNLACFLKGRLLSIQLSMAKILREGTHTHTQQQQVHIHMPTHRQARVQIQIFAKSELLTGRSKKRVE